MAYRILIVEDDTVIAQEIGRHLIRWGYETKAVQDFSDVMGMFDSFHPHLVLMDIGLPYYNGYYWCSELRKHSSVPVIFISSASDQMNIVMAVNMGGDDFIAKPFELEVLAAKIQAMLRRTYAFQSQAVTLPYQDCLLELSDMTLLYRDRKVEFTRNEYRILKLFFENPGKVIARGALMKQLWEEDCFVDDNTLTVNMNRLRRKLTEEAIPLCIQTRKGSGYQLK